VRSVGEWRLREVVRVAGYLFASKRINGVLLLDV